MGEQLSTLRIAGVALLLFSAILLGVGIHHLIAAGTCSSTGYSANYGPVPHCPSGTGGWFAFVFGGIIGSLAGSMMAGGAGLVFASIFGGIGFGALSLVFGAHVASSTKIFGAAFGGIFALISVFAWIAVFASALPALRRSAASPGPTSKTRKTNRARRGSARPVPATAGLSARSSAGGIVLNTAGRGPGVPVRAGSANAVDSLTKLNELRQQGVLTDTEFAAAKSKLLGEL